MKRSFISRIFFCVMSITFFINVYGQNRYVPTIENLQARESFQNDRFGIFLHWGLYSMIAQGEWYMNDHNINWKEYAKLASGFYPSRFDANQWVSYIKASGAKYICITTRHHDGFSMFDSDYTDFDIIDATPFKRDIIGELTEACKKQGIAIHFYYSHLDWSREDYPVTGTGRGTGRDTSKANWSSYYEFMNNQLKELLLKYHPRAIWFDGMWDKNPDHFDWQLEEQYAHIHKICPECLIANNHHRIPYLGEDFQIFERDLPGQNEAGLSGQDVSVLPLETCQTMNGMWGYKIEDQNYKSAATIIRYIVRAAGRNANLLLNIGPQPNGELPVESITKLREVGKWLAVNGETIYGTRGGDVTPREWGVTTRKGHKLYIHILDFKDQALFISLRSKIKSAVLFENKEPIRFKQDRDGILLKFNEVPSGIDYIVELNLK